MSTALSRRHFLFAAGASLAARAVPVPAQQPLTAEAVVARIKREVGIPWNDATYRDTFKAGRPDTVVRGIASTFMSSYDVIRRARAAGLNFIVTHEPTFWSDGDVVSGLRGDALYDEKLKYVESNGMAIWRFHDHWHARKPDGIFAGWNRALGWDRYVTPENDRRYVIPQTTLGDVARHVARAVQSRSVRMVGDAATRVRTIARGAHTLVGNMAAMPSADALLVSEAREWDSIEYARDTVASGQAKGIVLIAHEAGEEAGMDECARWLRTFVTEVPVQFIATTDLLWTPAT
jgi:putative NIF3 family GTP cyclohydrolase 1 type 2